MNSAVPETGRPNVDHRSAVTVQHSRSKSVPTIQQLVRKGRTPKVTKTKAPAAATKATKKAPAAKKTAAAKKATTPKKKATPKKATPKAKA